MAQAVVNSTEEATRLYETQVRADLLDPIASSRRPTAVIVAGQQGSPKYFAAMAVAEHLAPQVGAFATVSSDFLRSYHPAWDLVAASTTDIPTAVRSDVSTWYARLANDAMEKRANLLLITNMRQPQAAAAIAKRLLSARYEVSTVILAVDRDRSLQCGALRYEKLLRAGGLPAYASEAAHEDAYRKLRDWVANAEAEGLVTQVQILNDGGRQLYANRREADRWVDTPQGLRVLDDYRERRLSARELADTALRWQVLAHRFGSNADIPRSVAAHVVACRNDSTARAQTDAEAARLLALGLVAEAFRTMDRHQFVKEFPRYAKAATRMEQAIEYAHKNLASDADRRGFIAQARERVAERIAEGRFSLSRERAKDEAGPTR
jgi:hypothetical protein